MINLLVNEVLLRCHTSELIKCQQVPHIGTGLNTSFSVHRKTISIEYGLQDDRIY